MEELDDPKAANGLNTEQSSSCDYNSAFPKLVSEINQELLTSGAVTLPGTSIYKAFIFSYVFC